MQKFGRSVDEKFDKCGLWMTQCGWTWIMRRTQGAQHLSRMKMWCHMISHHKMSQDGWRDLRILKNWRMLISSFETKVSSRNRDTLCGPSCEVRPCPANCQNHVLLWQHLLRDNAPIPLMTALRPCVVTNWAPNASWYVLNVFECCWPFQL